MKINEGISKIRKSKNIKYKGMVDKCSCSSNENGLARRLTSDNMTMNTAVDLLNALDYEVVLQPKCDHSVSNNEAVQAIREDLNSIRLLIENIERNLDLLDPSPSSQIVIDQISENNSEE